MTPLSSRHQALVLSAFSALAISPVDAAADNWSNCRANDNCTIEFDHLATQKTDPFLFNGKIVDDEHPQWKRYKRALRRYPDVLSCLTDTGYDAVTPNLLKFDWDNVGTSFEAEICVFRVASSLGNSCRTIGWLEYQGFSHNGLNRTYSNNYQPYFETQTISQITARWPIEHYREITPSLFAWLTGYDLIYEYRLVLGFDQHQRISGVHAGTPTKLN